MGRPHWCSLQFGADHDDRAAGVVDALAEQVLAEAALLALEGVGERFQRAVVGAAQHAAAAAVIEQRVHGFLQHALFIAHDHVRRVQLDQLLQTVVAVDDAAVEVVQIGGGEAAAIERHQRTQFRRNDREHVENHPLRLVAGLAERFDDAQALGELQLLLLRRLGLHPLANLFAESSTSIFFSSSLMPSAPIMATNLPGNSWSSWRLRSSLMTSPRLRPATSPGSTTT